MGHCRSYYRPDCRPHPGSISIAWNRLVENGLVGRAKSVEDRRVRIVALSLRGKDLIVQRSESIPGR
jgi:DNA-binding MarR family transcriptional regulator